MKNSRVVVQRRKNGDHPLDYVLPHGDDYVAENTY